ncbi:MAG: hypothetical protein ABW171_08710 [Steroidobacter sp.]
MRQFQNELEIRPKLRSKLPVLAALALSCSAVVSSAALADELRTPRVTSESSERPPRGMTMDKVEATFGAPSSRTPAVGEPPITRWEYPGFTVYFEHQHVIHTVAAG